MKRGDTVSIFGAEDFKRLEQLLRDFVRDSNARSAVLIDRVGRLLSAAGQTRDFDEVAFASLAAADFAASDQLATRLGEKQFAALYHQGENSSMYLVDISATAILAALFDGGTTLGLVRLKTRDFIPGFAAVIADAESREESESGVVDADWIVDAEDEIDRLFGNRED